MKKISLIVIAVVLMSACCTGCKKENAINTEKFDYGSIKDSTIYVNKFFDFSIEIPKGWDIQTADETAVLMESGKEIVSGENKKLKESIEKSEINTANLLTAFEYDPATNTQTYNPSIMILAENVQNFNHIKSGSDYLNDAKKILSQSNISLKISPTYRHETIAGFDFDIMDAHNNYKGINISQQYYATVKNGFAFCMVLSCNNQKQKQKLMNAISTIGSYKDLKKRR
ncbi:hypothetical protein [Flavobacterium rhizosphaerae]|uniref:PsbP C-terminal domain-containing protein n=1 Tax=Flavobacterium rhizosphaerae TaxID=3163298 RepID=A0ABW8YY97_9FLAO